MNEKTKKILIYGSSVILIVGVGIYVYLKYYAGSSSSSQTQAAPNAISAPSSSSASYATGQAVVLQNYSPESFSGAALNGGYSNTPEMPVTQISSSANSNKGINSILTNQSNAIVNPTNPVNYLANSNINNITNSEIAANTAPVNLPTPSTPNLVLPTISQTQPTKVPNLIIGLGL